MINKSAILNLSWAIAPLLLMSCAHKVDYQLSEADKWAGTTIKKSIQIVNFEDDAPKDEKINFRMGREVYRINGRDGYAQNDISTPVSNMIGRHLEHSGLFENVYYGDKPVPEGESVDLVLNGSIYDYHGLGKMNRMAEFVVISGATFGNLPGYALALLATRNAQAEVQSNVRINDLKLTENSEEIWTKETIASSSKRQAYFIEGDNKGVFKLADKELRNVVNEMIDDIGESQTGETPERLERIEPKSMFGIEMPEVESSSRLDKQSRRGRLGE